MSAHTPTPWVAHTPPESNGYVFVSTPDALDDADVCTCYVAPTAGANAAHIVKCVNAHDELVAALARLVNRAFQYVGPDADTANPAGLYRAVWDARALLAKVGAS